jgi:hypothetical protein
MFVPLMDAMAERSWTATECRIGATPHLSPATGPRQSQFWPMMVFLVPKQAEGGLGCCMQGIGRKRPQTAQQITTAGLSERYAPSGWRLKYGKRFLEKASEKWSCGPCNPDQIGMSRISRSLVATPCCKCLLFSASWEIGRPEAEFSRLTRFWPPQCAPPPKKRPSMHPSFTTPGELRMRIQDQPNFSGRNYGNFNTTLDSETSMMMSPCYA